MRTSLLMYAVAAFAIASAADAASTTRYEAFQDAIVLLLMSKGDFMTEYHTASSNWQQNLSAASVRKMDVINRGFGGYNSNGLRGLWDGFLPKKGQTTIDQQIRMVTLWIGTNDARIGSSPLTVPLANFTSNVDYLLFTLTSPTSPYAISDTPLSIILIADQPIIKTQIDKWFKPDVAACMNNDNQRAYHDALMDLGKAWKRKERKSKYNRSGWTIETLDAWSVFTDAAGGDSDELLGRYFYDGIHFTAEGHQVFWSALATFIKSKFHGRGLDFDDTDDLPLRAPDFEDVDWSKPEEIPLHLAWPAFRKRLWDRVVGKGTTMWWRPLLGM